MDNKTAFKTLKNLGLACADKLEDLGFKAEALEGKNAPVFFGLGAYVALKMQGMDEQLDRAYEKVIQYIYDEGVNNEQQ